MPSQLCVVTQTAASVPQMTLQSAWFAVLQAAMLPPHLLLLLQCCVMLYGTVQAGVQISMCAAAS
jgi:hypothetical protein